MKRQQNIIYRMLAYIGESVYDKKGGKISSTRMASYFILGGILTSMFLLVGIELVNAITMWKQGLGYVMPGEHITIFGMVLAHHLTLLGINKYAERKVDVATQDTLKAHNQLNPRDMPTEVPGSPEDMEEGSSDSNM
jgi:hypothetical protein